MDAAALEALAGRYGHLARVIRRGRRIHPAALDEALAPSISSAVVAHDGRVSVDAELRRGGTPHLELTLARGSSIFDGAVLALDHIDGGAIHAAHASYFDMIATCDALPGNPALRDHAERLAAPDPLRVGNGRAAAIGVTAVVVRDGRFTLGRRSANLALDPGRWHIVPSGTVDARGLAATLEDELRGEHHIEEVPPMRVIGLGYDLARLRPELALITDDLGQIGPPPPTEEFSEFREVRLDSDAISAVWELDLTAAASVALAALERELRG